MFVRLPAVEAAGFYPSDAVRETDGDDVVCDMRGVFLMMAERTYGIFESGRPVRVGRRPYGRIAFWSDIEGEQILVSQLEVV